MNFVTSVFKKYINKQNDIKQQESEKIEGNPALAADNTATRSLAEDADVADSVSSMSLNQKANSSSLTDEEESFQDAETNPGINTRPLAAIEVIKNDDSLPILHFQANPYDQILKTTNDVHTITYNAAANALLNEVNASPNCISEDGATQSRSALEVLIQSVNQTFVINETVHENDPNDAEETICESPEVENQKRKRDEVDENVKKLKTNRHVPETGSDSCDSKETFTELEITQKPEQELSINQDELNSIQIPLEIGDASCELQTDDIFVNLASNCLKEPKQADIKTKENPVLMEIYPNELVAVITKSANTGMDSNHTETALEPKSNIELKRDESYRVKVKENIKALNDSQVKIVENPQYLFLESSDLKSKENEEIAASMIRTLVETKANHHETEKFINQEIKNQNTQEQLADDSKPKSREMWAKDDTADPIESDIMIESIPERQENCSKVITDLAACSETITKNSNESEIIGDAFDQSKCPELLDLKATLDQKPDVNTLVYCAEKRKECHKELDKPSSSKEFEDKENLEVKLKTKEMCGLLETDNNRSKETNQNWIDNAKGSIEQKISMVFDQQETKEMLDTSAANNKNATEGPNLSKIKIKQYENTQTLKLKPILIENNQQELVANTKIDEIKTDIDQTYYRMFERQDTEEFETLEKECKNHLDSIKHNIDETLNGLIADPNDVKNEPKKKAIEEGCSKVLFKRQDTLEFEHLEQQCAENVERNNKSRIGDIIEELVSESNTTKEPRQSDELIPNHQQHVEPAFYRQDTQEFEYLEQQCTGNVERRNKSTTEGIIAELVAESNATKKPQQSKEHATNQEQDVEPVLHRQDTQEFENLERQCAENVERSNKSIIADILEELVSESIESNERCQAEKNIINEQQDTNKFKSMEKQCTESFKEDNNLGMVDCGADEIDKIGELATNIKATEPDNTVCTTNQHKVSQEEPKVNDIIFLEEDLVFGRQDTENFNNLEKQFKEVDTNLDLCSDDILKELVAQGTNQNIVEIEDLKTNLKKEETKIKAEMLGDVTVNTMKKEENSTAFNQESLQKIKDVGKNDNNYAIQIKSAEMFDNLIEDGQDLKLTSSTDNEGKLRESKANDAVKAIQLEKSEINKQNASDLVLKLAEETATSSRIPNGCFDPLENQITGQNVDMCTENLDLANIEIVENDSKQLATQEVTKFLENKTVDALKHTEDLQQKLEKDQDNKKKQQNQVEANLNGRTDQIITKSISMKTLERVQEATSFKISDNANDELKSKVDSLQRELDSIKKLNRRKNQCIMTSSLNKEADRDIKLKYRNILIEYDKRILQQSNDLEKLKMECESNVRNFTNAEMAFSDVYEKYEKAKCAIAAYRKNEDVLLKNIENAEEQLSQVETKCSSMREQSMEQIRRAQEQVAHEKEKYKKDLTKLQTQMKRLEIKASSLEVALKQKSDECQALASLCDDITGRRSTSNNF